MKESLKKLRAILIPIHGERESEAIIRLIFHFLKGWDTTQMLIHSDEVLSPYIKNSIDKILSRLEKREPIQYITGEARFHGLDLKVSPSVLIPRPETSELVDIITEDAGDKQDIRILDIGTGSGAIAVALSRTLRFPVITAIDMSPEAIEIAKQNAKNLKSKIKFVIKDILNESLDGEFDIIISNPPYVTESEKKFMQPEVSLYEPPTALFVSDSDPLIFYKRITDLALKNLIINGKLYFEINPQYAESLKKYVESVGFQEVEIIRDSFGKQRFLRAVKLS